MKSLLSFALIAFYNFTLAQDKYLEFDRFSDCLIESTVHNSDSTKVLAETEWLKDLEVVVFRVTKKGKIKSFERGYINTQQIGGDSSNNSLGTEANDSTNIVMKYPLLKQKNYFVYGAACYNKKVKRASR